MFKFLKPKQIEVTEKMQYAYLKRRSKFSLLMSFGIATLIVALLMMEGLTRFFAIPLSALTILLSFLLVMSGDAKYKINRQVIAKYKSIRR